MNRRSGDLLVLFAGRTLQVTSTLISVRVVTTLLGPAEIGRMNLVVSLVSLFSLLLISPVANYVARQSIEWNLDNQLLGALLRFGLFLVVSVLVSATVVLVIESSVGIGTQINRGWLIGFVVANLFFSGLVSTVTTIINTIGHRVWFVLLVNLAAWSGLGVAYILVMKWGVAAEHWLEGLLLGQIVVAVIATVVVYKLSRRPKPKQSNPAIHSSPGFVLHAAMEFSWPLVFATGFYWMQTSGYLFVLARVADVKTIGLVTIGLSLGLAPMAMFDTLFTEYYRPLFYKDIARGDNTIKAQAWNKYASAYFPCVVLVGAMIGVSGPFLARILVSAQFQPIGWLAFWGALIKATFMVYATFVSLSFALLNTRLLILPNLLGAAVALAAIYILAQKQPLLGTGLALFLGMLVTMLAVGVRLRRKVAIQFPWQRLGVACLLALPMVVVIPRLQELWGTPSLIQALLVLAAAGFYTILSLIIMARGWLYERQTNITARGDIDA